MNKLADSEKKLMGLAEEFKKFISRGNVIDMAVGVIIGGAFGKIVSSLVSDIIMPTLGIVLGKVNLAELTWTLRHATEDAPAIVIKYGNFLQSSIDFLIIALAIFFFLKIIFSFQRKAEAAPAAPPAPTKEEQLLTEIRDILKEKK